MFQRNALGNIKTRVLCSVTFYPENRAVYEKYCRAEQAKDDNMAHEHYMLDN